MFSWTERRPRSAAMFVRVVVAAVGIATGAAITATPRALAFGGCPPDSEPASGCDCSWRPPGFAPCGCCEDTEGIPRCMYCATE